jgi:hypothetical protein
LSVHTSPGTHVGIVLVSVAPAVAVPYGEPVPRLPYAFPVVSSLALV